MNSKEPTYINFSSDYLRNFTIEVFKHFGVPAKDAETASDVLALADLRGIDSHGVARLLTYVDMLQNGRINPNPAIKVIRSKHSVATVDGDNGLGLVVGPFANQIAIEKAQQHGSGWVAVCHTNHFGIGSYYTLQANEHDLIGMAMTNSTKLVAPFNGRDRMLGTNPIAISFPVESEKPVVIDLATSAAAFGKIEIARRKKISIPSGWVIDSLGLPSTNPEAMFAGGALVPLGSDADHGGHKGYALAAMVDILTCVLSGANWGPFAPPFALRQEIPERSVGKGIGHFFGAMDIDGFIDLQEFKNMMKEWVTVYRNARPAPNAEKVLVPGDPEHTHESIRSVSGIPVIEAVVSDLQTIASRTGIPFELP